MPKSLHMSTGLTLAAAGVILLPSLASACSVCMGAADNETVFAVNMAVILLLGVTGGMLSSVGAFVLHLRRRARQITQRQHDNSV